MVRENQELLLKSRSIEVDIAVESNRRKRGDADDLTRKAYMLLDWMADML